jgi:hypothetical protein
MALSANDKLLLERIEGDFTYHAPDGETAERYIKLRRDAKALAKLMVELCVDSRERSVAITKLEEALFWANAAIARGKTDD